MAIDRRRQWLVVEPSVAGPRQPYASRIAAAGRRLPSRHLSSADLMASTRHRTGIDLERLTGIHERRVAAGDEDSLLLACGAATDALERCGRSAEQLDVVVSCSITKYRHGLVHWFEPPMSAAIARRIGAAGAMTFDVSNACAGMLTAVFILNNWIRQGAIRRGMAVSGEYISQLGRNAAAHVHSVVSGELASLTLGDAGAALVVERADPGVVGITMAGFTTIAEHSRLCLAYPAAHDPGARMFTRSQALQQAAINDIPTLLGEALGVAGMDIGEIDHVIPHQTSTRAIRKGMARVSETLGEPRHPAVVTVDHYGNTASTTHTVALVEEMEAGHVRAGDRVALVALASGLVVGVVLFTTDSDLVATYGNHH